MVKKLFKKNGIILVLNPNKQLTIQHYYFMIQHYKKNTKDSDYLLDYYKEKGCIY